MNAEQKQQAKQLIADWTNVSKTSTPAVWFLNGDCMAGFLQELVDAPEVLTATNPAQISSSAEPSTDVVRDAERYRWLRDKCRATGEHWGGRWSLVIEGPCPDGDKSSGAIDKAIDAARKRQGGES